MKRFFAIVVPDYFWLVLASLVIVITNIMQAILTWITHKIVTGTDAKVEVVVQHTNGMLTHLQEQVDRQQVDKDHLAVVTELETKLAAAKASDRETP
jgi:ABC-type multidrug transport system fused ATPase/permease subunit